MQTKYAHPINQHTWPHPAAGAQKHMKNLARIATPVMAIVLMAGCKSATEVQVSELQGTWLASQARYSGLEDPKNNNFDLIEEGFTVVFASDGSGDFAVRLDDPDGGSEVITGTMAIDGTNVVITGNIDRTGEVFVEGDQMAFSIDGGLEVDFNGNGEEIPARLLLVLDRESLTVPSL